MELEKYAVISVLGEHAGEPVEAILDRKQKDIQKIGFTFWLINSASARVKAVQEVGRVSKQENERSSCLFISGSSANATVPAKTNAHAKEFSEDCVNFEKLPAELSPVSGKLGKSACALVLESLDKPFSKEQIDLWRYSKFGSSGLPAKFRQGDSTGCFTRCASPIDGGMKSRFRDIVAYGRLKEPFAVYLR